jgi:hypothetical protein
MSSSLLLHSIFLLLHVSSKFRITLWFSADSNANTGIQFQVHDWFNHEAVSQIMHCGKRAKANPYRVTKHTTFPSKKTTTGPRTT